MKVIKQTIQLETKKQFEIVDITSEVAKTIEQSAVKSGIALVFCPHTTATIRINNSEHLLFQDIMKMIYRLVPLDTNYAHDVFEIRENVSVGERTNGHAHLKSFLFGSSETIPVENGKLLLGPKQSIFFVDFDGARQRDYIVSVLGE